MKTNYTNETALKLTEATGGMIKFQYSGSYTKDIVPLILSRGSAPGVSKANKDQCKKELMQLLEDLQDDLPTGNSRLFENNGGYIRAVAFGAFDAQNGDEIVNQLCQKSEEKQPAIEEIYARYNITLPQQEIQR